MTSCYFHLPSPSPSSHEAALCPPTFFSLSMSILFSIPPISLPPISLPPISTPPLHSIRSDKLDPSETTPRAPDDSPKSPITHSGTKVTQPPSGDVDVAGTPRPQHSSSSSPASSTPGDINIHTDDATNTLGILPTSSAPLSSTPPVNIAGEGGAHRPPVALIVGLLTGTLILTSCVALFLYRRRRATSAANALRGRPFLAIDVVSGVNESHHTETASMPPNMQQKGPLPALPPILHSDDIELFPPDSPPPD
ncbi:hypothetical protein C8J57DRAFT_1352238 [Mycena rebaudengoi]|nr:hypothetical protein C8J57DRAFT_1352238 [Mycena rebaudengoi]